MKPCSCDLTNEYYLKEILGVQEKEKNNQEAKFWEIYKKITNRRIHKADGNQNKK